MRIAPALEPTAIITPAVTAEPCREHLGVGRIGVNGAAKAEHDIHRCDLPCRRRERHGELAQGEYHDHRQQNRSDAKPVHQPPADRRGERHCKGAPTRISETSVRRRPNSSRSGVMNMLCVAAIIGVAPTNMPTEAANAAVREALLNSFAMFPL